jgi:hypothetical protein
MVDPESMQKRGLKVVDGQDPLHRLISKFVSRAVDVTGLEAAARQPERKSVAVVVAALVLLRDRQPSELTRPEHDRLVQQPALFEIADQGRAGLVGLGAERFERLGVLGVRIPGLAAQEKLDEPHTAFNEAAGDQAAGSIFPGDRVGPGRGSNLPRARYRARAGAQGPAYRLHRHNGPGSRGDSDRTAIDLAVERESWSASFNRRRGMRYWRGASGRNP